MYVIHSNHPHAPASVSLLCHSASTAYVSSCHCDIHPGSWRNFLVNSASGGLGVYTHKYTAPAVESSEHAAEGRKMFIPSIASTLTDAHIELL